MNINPILCSVFLAVSGSASAAKPIMECYTNPRTDEMQCIDVAAVVADEPIRMASLYTGGPIGLRKTSFFVAANCTTGVTHLKDKNGVSFAGGYGSETPAIKRLKELICSATPTNISKKKK